MSLLYGMYNCSGGSYIHMWNANAYSDCSSSPRFPASCPLRLAKTIPHCLQRISFSFALLSIPLFIKISCQIFYFDNICILYVMLLDAGRCITEAEKVWKKSTSFILRLCKLSYASAVSLISFQMCHFKLWNTLTARRGILLWCWNSFIQPITPLCVCYRIGYLNFHRLSCSDGR